MIQHDSSTLTKVRERERFCTKQTGLVIILLIQAPILFFFYKSEILVFSKTYFGYSIKPENQTYQNFFSKVESSIELNHSIYNVVQDQNNSVKVALQNAHVINTTNESPVSSTIIDSPLPQCPETPPNLQGLLEISFADHPHSFTEIEKDNPNVNNGGYYKPPNCLARSKVAIIIPFRDRDEHLRYFLQFMHPVLQRQQLEYRVYIINQFGKGKFNRAKLMNVGFVESNKDLDFGCFVFHDVDLILENDKALYTCPERPRHLSAAVDKFNYNLPYQSIFGGVTELTKEQFTRVNGYSNSFWGWGGEDDDMFNRLSSKNMTIMRYGMSVSRYRMINHRKDAGNEPNPKRFDLIRVTRVTMKNDGLNSLHYNVISSDIHPLYTNITVDLHAPNR